MTTMTKRFFGALLTLAMVLSTFATTPAEVRAASADEPYCTIWLNGNTGNLYYYEYSTDGFKAINSRCLWWSQETHQLLLSGSNLELSKNLKAGTEPAYAEKGQYIVWQEPNNILMVSKFGSKEKAQEFKNVVFFQKNNEGFVTKVFFTDGTEKTFAEFMAAPAATASPVSTATPAPTATASATPTATPVATATPAPTTVPTATPVATATPAPTVTPVATVAPTPVAYSLLSVEVSIDSAARTIYCISNGHKVMVDGKSVYYDDVYKISELCASSVRFIGIDDKGRVYLYEDATASYYRFNPDNIFSPEKIKLAAGATLVKAVTNANNILTAIETSMGIFKVDQLAVDTTWYPNQTYAINKSGYCEYYFADTSEKYILTLKDGKLYLGVKEIRSDITRNDGSFGFVGNEIVALTGSISYKAPISDPTNWRIWKQNCACLEYSTKDGTVSGVRKLTTKRDYVENSSTHKSASLYQSCTKVKGVKIASNGASVSVDGKVICKLSKKQKKAKVKYTAVGFTEDGYIYVATNKAKYRALLSAPTKLKKWNISRVVFDNLGFCSKG